jgi:hypothetical protein
MNEPLPFTRLERAIANFFAPRMGWWLYLSIALLAGVAYFALPMLKVILYKVVILTLMGFIGDKIARHLEDTNKRPHELLGMAWAMLVPPTPAPGQDLGPVVLDKQQQIDLAVHWERRADAIYYRRAIVIAAAMIAGALGT